MITLNIGWFILICIILFIFGFFTSGFMSGSKISELDEKLMNEKINNNRKDQVIDFYRSNTIPNNTKVTDVIKENQKRSKQ